MRKWVVLISGVAILLGLNVVIYQRERLLTTGQVMMLELAPVDPRSLMQGDYMALRFALADEAFRSPATAASDGQVVVELDELGVARYRRHADGAANVLGPDEALLRYRVRHGRPQFGTNAFFFQEGHADLYADARYGVLRVAPDGEAILVALRGPRLERLGPSP